MGLEGAMMATGGIVALGLLGGLIGGAYVLRGAVLQTPEAAKRQYRGMHVLFISEDELGAPQSRPAAHHLRGTYASWLHTTNGCAYCALLALLPSRDSESVTCCAAAEAAALSRHFPESGVSRRHKRHNYTSISVVCMYALH